MSLIQENAQSRDEEADEVVWMPLEEAARRLSYLNERDIVRKAKKILRKHGS